MNVEEFLSTLDALRFDDVYDEKYPELRGLIRKVYPYIRKIYNIMYDNDLLSESKINESLNNKWYVVEDGEQYNVFSEEDIQNYGIEHDQIIKVFNDMNRAFDYAEKKNRETEESSPYFSPMKGYYNESKINEVHGAKKHKTPKDTLSAVRKGNREAEREIYGDGFKSKKKIHKTGKTFDRKNNKVDINNLQKYQNESIQFSENDIKTIITECVKKILKEDIDEKIDWGMNVEQLISKLENKFAEIIAPEEDEYGISSTPFKKLISHLKYYYEHERFDSYCFNAIYEMLDNYDMIQDGEIMEILKQLKKLS